MPKARRDRRNKIRKSKKRAVHGSKRPLAAEIKSKSIKKRMKMGSTMGLIRLKQPVSLEWSSAKTDPHVSGHRCTFLY
jgi:hypothetical protein